MEALFFKIFSADGLAAARAALGKSTRDPRIAQIESVAAAPGFMRPLISALLSLSGRAGALRAVRNYGPFDAHTHWSHLEALDAYRARVNAEFAQFDVLLSPACPLPALKHGAGLELGVMGTYTTLFNLLGWPAGVIPWTSVTSGEESDRRPMRDPAERAAALTEAGSVGLPIGVHVAAAPWRDEVALSVMAQLQDVACARPGYPSLERVW